MYTRRTLLGSAAAAGATLPLAGCTGALGGDAEGDTEDEDGTDGDDPDGTEAEGTNEDTDTRTTEEPDGARLGELSIQNTHDEDHRIQLAVEAGEEMLHLGTYELDADGGSRTIEGAWGETPGEYRIHVTLDDGDVRTTNVIDSIGTGTDCARVLVRVGTGGDLAVWTGANCGASAGDSDLADA
ncbi:hypothetical protein [Natronomonas sp. LN261]|jgi:hypothetical protein|uniref:hypothetical protein n=1 Tax=Natronomonas sp. LN261 TaxID=2750669 RepID=UPI0015EEF954|nr:hypothetical protein [Natronomonas sp. LN261]